MPNGRGRPAAAALGDEEPPVFDNANDGNTDPNSYDVIGRYFYVGGKLKF